MNEIFEMKEYAKENSVPILKDGTRDFIIEYIKMHNIKKILEIGSAIGYSAISFAQTSPDISVDTIEYDFERYQTAFKNVQNHNLADRITVYLGDAADFTTDEKYDLIFIDGPKAQNLKFFMKFSNNLSENGVIITDNLSFHGMVEDENLTHNYSTKKMVRKIRRYVTFLKENPEFTTEFFPVGDTISVSKKNKNPDFSLYLENTPIVDYSLVVFGFVQSLGIQIGTGSYHTDDFPFYNPPGLFRIFHLLTDCHFITAFYQSVDIGLGCMERDAAHGRAFFQATIFSG